MFERLLELFFHAKVGTLAGLILVGTTGALVTATASSANGVTAITLTQASASPSANNQVQSPTASPTASPKATPAAALNTTPTAPQTNTTAPACDPAKAGAASDAVKTVDTAYAQFHTDLMGMRKDAKSDAAKTLLENTDKLLKDIRQSAVKAIHATASCSNDKDVEEQNGDVNDNKTDMNDDKDANDEKDADDESGDNDGDHEHKSGTEATKPSTPATVPTTPTVTTTTGDAKTIADNAVAAMKLAFDTAKSQLAAANANTTPASPKAAKSPKASDKGNHGD